MESDETILYSCRVCRVPNQEGEFESLYNEVAQLTAAGQLYEELIGEKIEPATSGFYPQYLCNSCDLQMKLFKKLKTKSNKTLQDLKQRYEIVQKDQFLEEYQDKAEEIDQKRYFIEDNREKEEVDELENILSTSDVEEESKAPTEDEIAFIKQEKNQQLVKIEDDTNQDEQRSSNEGILTDAKSQDIIDKSAENVSCIELLEDDCKLDVETEYLDDVDCEIIENHVKNKQEYENSAGNENSSDLIPANFEEFLPVEDEFADMDGESGEYIEILDDTSQETTAPQTAEDIFLDVQYLDIANEEEKLASKKHYCRACNLIFYKRADYQRHRKQKHFSKYPCSECSKVFQTTDALRVHINLHRGLAPYQCELCSKTFNQKVHLNYHMDKHYNIRKFKCEVCGKAFLAKGDLAIHMRSHTNERKYACDICSKEFLMHEHMKNHRFSHFEKRFECQICKQKFVSPSTLRTHMKSIHEDEPRFQCEYCVKKFRRKHHLEAHYKVHRKLIAVAVEDYETAIDEISNCEDESLLIVTEDDAVIHEQIREIQENGAS